MPLFLQLQLSTSPPFFDSPVIMLDDIKFENCADGDVLEGSDQLSCGFEDGTCSWYADYTAGILWKNESDALDKDGEYFSVYLSVARVCSRIKGCLMFSVLLL